MSESPPPSSAFPPWRLALDACTIAFGLAGVIANAFEWGDLLVFLFALLWVVPALGVLLLMDLLDLARARGSARRRQGFRVVVDVAIICWLVFCVALIEA